jgi:hypothetical protein
VIPSNSNFLFQIGGISDLRDTRYTSQKCSIVNKVIILSEIKEDSLVRYKGTGTVGTVKVLKDEDGEKWALLDSTGLYYRLDTLEPIDRLPERTELEGMTMEQIQERFKAQQEMMDKAKMQDANLETGG